MASLPDRAQLERLDRENLIARAEALGVSRANILTRPELVDEVLLRSASKDDLHDPRVARARGFFGRARDLLARVIERGLHLPDAAERLRRVSVAPPPKRTSQPAVPTVTLAEIYAAQGHRGRAIETLKRVLDHEPEHSAAQALLKQLSEQQSTLDASPAGSTTPGTSREGRTQASGSPSEPPLSAAPPEPQGFLDDDTLPWRYDVDECVAISVDPTTLFVYWEIREETLTHLRRSRQDGMVALRVLVITPSWEGPRSATTDIDVGEPIADWFVRSLPPGAIVRVAVGWRQRDVFVPIAHSSAIETPPDSPSPMLAEAFLAFSPQGLARIGASTTAEAAAVLGGRGHAGSSGVRGRALAALRARGVGGGPGSPDGQGEPLGSSDHAYA
jgi:hypothetical protein